MEKYLVYVGIKLPRLAVLEAKRRADDEDRALSAYLRRLILEGLERKEKEEAAAASLEPREAPASLVSVEAQR